MTLGNRTCGLVAVLGLMVLSACASAPLERFSVSASQIVAQPRPSLVTVTESKVEIDQKIAFTTWQAELLEESLPILDEIASTLLRHQEIAKVEIQGHTAKAGDVQKLMKLSVDRAQAVRDYLVERGVEADRLIARGYGETQPIAANETEEGREQNRRVEFIIVERSTEPVAAAQRAAGSEATDSSIPPSNFGGDEGDKQ